MQKPLGATLKHEQLNSNLVKYLDTYSSIYIKVVFQFLCFLLD